MDLQASPATHILSEALSLGDIFLTLSTCCLCSGLTLLTILGLELRESIVLFL